MRKQNTLIYKWYMDYQLTQVDDYLSFLNKGLKSLPENQAIVLAQYAIDSKKKPVQMDFSNHFTSEPKAVALSDGSHYASLLLEMSGDLSNYLVI